MEASLPTRAAPVFPGLPLLGAILEVAKDPVAAFTRAAGFGDVVEMNFAGLRAFLVNDPLLVDRLLHDNYKAYGKQTRGYAALRTVLGNGLLTSEGSFWLRQRRLAQPAFHREHIAAWGEVMVNAARDMVKTWDMRLARRDAFDLHDEMMRVTLRVVGETILSTDVANAASREVGDVLGPLLKLLSQRVTRTVQWPEWVPLPSHIRISRYRARLDAVVAGIIAERRQQGAGNDLLGMFMSATDVDTGERMDDAQLRDEVMTIMLAGHETTANALSWSFYLLSGAPEAERRLRDELATALQGRTPTAADLPKLPYTAAVLNEAMRLYPPVWIIARSATDGDVLGGVRIPKGAVTLFSPYLLHRRPDHWPNPEAFQPERWLTEHKRPRCAYVPFSSGPRKCIGDQFALLEGALVLATVMQHARLTLVPGQRIVPDPSFTLRPLGGLWVTGARV